MHFDIGRRTVVRMVAVIIVLGALATRSALATNITVDGNLSDWGVTVDYTKVDRPNSAWAPTLGGVSWWAEDNTNVGGLGSGSVGPGYGGQNFDIEAAYSTSANNTLYGAVVTGFDRAGQYGWDTSVLYATGDLFFDIGADGTWDFAIALSNHDGFVMGQAYVPTSPGAWYTIPTDYPSSAPSQLLAGDTFTVLPGTQYAYSQGTTLNENALASDPYQPADHNIIEVSLDENALRTDFPTIISGTEVVMHYTESCGNDVVDLTGAIIYTPEPGTWALLGLALVMGGACAWWRRKSERTCPTNAA